MKRPIEGFHRDDEGWWVADLSCGHTQHVRHRPPQETRTWVTTEEGRASRIGTDLDCLFCDMPPIPDDAAPYRETRSFDASTIPTGLTRDHRTKEGVWGRIVVEAGRLAYTLGETTWVLRPGVDGHIPPDRAHHVEPVGDVRFKVVFLRRLRVPPEAAELERQMKLRREAGAIMVTADAYDRWGPKDDYEEAAGYRRADAEASVAAKAAEQAIAALLSELRAHRPEVVAAWVKAHHALLDDAIARADDPTARSVAEDEKHEWTRLGAGEIDFVRQNTQLVRYDLALYQAYFGFAPKGG